MYLEASSFVSYLIAENFVGEKWRNFSDETFTIFLPDECYQMIEISEGQCRIFLIFPPWIFYSTHKYNPNVILGNSNILIVIHDD